MEELAPLAREEIGHQLITRHHNSSEVGRVASASSKCLDNTRENAVVQKRNGTHLRNEEPFLKVCRPRQTFDDQETTFILREIDAVVAVCDDRHCGWLRDELDLGGFYLPGVEDRYSQPSGHPLPKPRSCPFVGH